MANVFDFVYIRKMLNLSYRGHNHQHYHVIEIMQKSFMEAKPVLALIAEDDADNREFFIEAFSIVDPTITSAFSQNRPLVKGNYVLNSR